MFVFKGFKLWSSLGVRTLSKSKGVRGIYCIVLSGERHEFQHSTKDTLISRRVKCLVRSALIFSYFKCNTDSAREMADSPAQNKTKEKETRVKRWSASEQLRPTIYCASETKSSFYTPEALWLVSPQIRLKTNFPHLFFFLRVFFLSRAQNHSSLIASKTKQNKRERTRVKRWSTSEQLRPVEHLLRQCMKQKILFTRPKHSGQFLLKSGNHLRPTKRYHADH